MCHILYFQMFKFRQLSFFITLLRFLELHALELEQAVGCMNGGDSCVPTQRCATGCLDCFANRYQCKVCQTNYFLFTLPQDNPQIGLLRGNQVCVSCPSQTYLDLHSIYCGDCIENSGGWEQTRICSYDYIVRGSDSDLGTYQSIPSPQSILFFVVPIKYDQTLAALNIIAPYGTAACAGCGYFCPTQTLICQNVNSLYLFDASKQFVACANGFVYSKAIDGCDSCPANCQSCTISVESLSEEDEIFFQTQKSCLVCNNGFALFKGYPKNNNQISAIIDTRCEACYLGCLACYYGSDVLNLNLNPDQWSVYTQNMTLYDTFDRVIARLKNSSIEQRCASCQQSVTAYYLPSLTMTQCEQCHDYCGQCEYTTYQPQYQGTIQQYPTQYQIPIINQTQQSDYILRCRKCQNYTYTFNYQGLECDENTIGNCSIAYYDIQYRNGTSTNTNTMDPDYSPTPFGKLLCGLCNNTFQKSADNTTCKPAVINLLSPTNCAIYETTANNVQICSQCATGYSLNMNNLCIQGCAFIINDFFCSSCYSYSYVDHFGATINELKCLLCVFGYYPDITTGRCSSCSQDPAIVTCGQCQQYSSKQIYTNNIQVRKPQYTDGRIFLFILGQITDIKNNDNIVPQVICNKCAPNVGYNSYSRYCENCKANCMTCNYNAITAFCGQCTTAIQSRSSTVQGNDCLQCPLNCVGCRDRSPAESLALNPYFAPDSPQIQYFSRICYKCSNPPPVTNMTLIYNSKIGRCISCNSKYGCYLSETINIYMYCLSGAVQKKYNFDPLASSYYDLSGFYLAKTEAFATIHFNTFENDDNFITWNNEGVDTMTINLFLIQKNGAQINNDCVMQKDTYITTKLSNNVFSLINLKLNIQVINETLIPVPNQSKIVLYIFKNLYIQYFNFVTISGIQISPSVDYNYKYPNAQNSLLKKNPFGIILTLNQRSSLVVKNVHILQTQALEVYNNKSMYPGPANFSQVQLKRYNPFFFNLLNTYYLELDNVTFSCFSYLNDREVKFNGMPFTLFYDSPQTQANFNFTNVTFEDFAMESRYILQLQPMTFFSADPSIVQSITINGFTLQDSYFVNQAGVFGQQIAKIESCGVINVNNFQELRDTHNSSNGLFNFFTVQKMVMGQSLFQNNSVNNTFQIYVNTLEVSNIEVLGSTYTTFGRFIHTQEKASQVRPNMADLTGLTLSITKARFSNITCLSINCMVHAVTPSNIYFLLMNVTLSFIEIGNVNSSGFAPNLIDSANSAIIFISHIYQVTVTEFLSVNNKNLTILNINDVQFIGINKYSCLSTQNTGNNNASAIQYKDNMCLYVSNFYQQVVVNQILIQNLLGIDNSFMVFQSWDILVYNTTQPGIRETIIISDLQVLTCTIFTKQISSVSSSLNIQSQQMQLVQVSYSQFLHNTQLSFLKSTLTPSNPTLLTQSIVGEINIHDCIWRDNQAGGQGATLYIQMGKGNLTNLQMVGSNWMRQDQGFQLNYDLLVFQANNVSYGGHLYLQGYYLIIQNCSFQNASAVRGTGVYILSVADGVLIMVNTTFMDLLTPLNPAAESQGGCLYIDSSSSRLNMTMTNIQMSNCAVRGDGGCIYLNPSSLSHRVTIQDSSFYNCFSLGGSLLKVSFDLRTIETQILTIQNSQIIQNYWDYVAYMSQVSDQNSYSGLNAIEQYLFLQRSAVIEQNSGYIVINNVAVSDIHFQGFLSLSQVRSINIQNLNVADSIIIYRPLIEVLNPFLYPTVMNNLNFDNISSYTPESINCSAPNTTYRDQQLFQSNQFKCNLIQARIEYPDQQVNPAIIFVNSVTLKALLQLSVISITSTTCNDCFGGLISIIGVYNGDPLIEMVSVESFSCHNSTIGYYGCLFASRLSAVDFSTDDVFLNMTYVSNYDVNILQGLTGTKSVIPQRLRNSVQQKFASFREGIDTETSYLTASKIINTNDNDHLYIPTNPFAAHIRVQDVKVSGLNATHGAAIGIRGLTANITNLVSFQCHSIASGGSIYFQADPKIGVNVMQRLNLLRSDFVESQAQIGGAIRTIESGVSDVNQSLVSFLNNHAKYYGNDVATYPSRMSLVINGTTQKQLRLNQNAEWVASPITINSGQSFNIYQQQQIVLALLDDDANTVGYQMKTNSILNTNPRNHISGSGLREFSNIVQGFDFSDLVINLDPYVYTTLNIMISSDAVFIPRYSDFPPYYLRQYDKNYTLQGRIRSVECSKGESYNKNDGSCSPCGPGTYVLQPLSVCLVMDQQSMNETYLNQISLNRGYWRSEITIDKTELCFNQLTNCNGGWNVGNDMCTVGNIGALCEACDWQGVRWGQPYTASEKLSCIPCANAKTNTIIIALLSVWTLFSIITSIRGTKEAMEQQYLAEICFKIGWSSGQKTGANKAIMMKMLTNYQQIVGILAQFQLTIPSNVISVSNTVGQPTQALGNSLECLLIAFTPGIDILYWRIIFSLMMQIGYITLILFFLLVGHFSKKLEFKVQYVQTMFLFMFIFLHPSYVRDFILLVSQRTISEESWVQANVSYRYDTWNHQRWTYILGWPGLIIWGLLLPLSFLYVVNYGAKNNKLEKIFFRNSWGFFYNEYKLKCYYWEFIRIFQKQLIIIIMVFYTDDVIVKGILVFVVIYLYGRLTQNHRPYVLQSLNKLDILSTNCCALTIILGVLIYRALQSNVTYITIICYIALGFLNAFFYAFIIYFLLGEYLIIMMEKLDDQRDKIVAKKPHLLENPKYRPYLINRTKLNKDVKLKWKKLAGIVNVAVNRVKDKLATHIEFVNSELLIENLETETQQVKLENLKNQINDIQLQFEEESPIVDLQAQSIDETFKSEDYQVDYADQHPDTDKYRQD